MAKKSTWDPRMNRYERMKAAWVDAMRQGVTKLPFAMFEERMLERDLKIRKEEFLKRRIVIPANTPVAQAMADMANAKN